MNRRPATCVLAVFVAMLSGCGLFENKSTDVGGAQVGAGAGTQQQASDMTLPVPHMQPPISDVPVPMNFKINENKSRNYAISGVRFVDHVYTGRGDKFVLKRFFERYMVMNRWTLATFVFAQGRVVLDFEKDYERCQVTIWESDFFLGPTTISVILWPNKPSAGRGETPKT